MSVDRTDPRPPSRQIADGLREAIRDGHLPPGTQLPSERELSEQHQVAPQTAREAVKLLKAEGLVTSLTGRGVFVRNRPPIVRVGSDRYARWRRDQGKAPFQAEMESLGLAWRQEILELAEVAAPDRVADWFEIAPGAPVFVRRRRTWIEDRPSQLADSYYPLDVVRGTAIMREDTGPGGGHARLEEKGHRITRFREEITLRMPTPDETRSLRLDKGIPVADLQRITFSHSTPIEVFSAILAGDMHVFCYEFPAPD